MKDLAHEVCVPCDCGDVEHCRMELYVSDVRRAYAEREWLEFTISKTIDALIEGLAGYGQRPLAGA